MKSYFLHISAHCAFGPREVGVDFAVAEAQVEVEGQCSRRVHLDVEDGRELANGMVDARPSLGFGFDLNAVGFRWIGILIWGFPLDI